MKFLCLLAALSLFPLVSFSQEEDEAQPDKFAGDPLPEAEDLRGMSPEKKYYWFRDAGEWIASRSVRETLMAEPTALVITDGKRYDVVIGKRLNLVTFSAKSRYEAWSVGIDLGMQASLTRSKNASGRLSFATENFDGFFGIYGAKNIKQSLFMVRVAHLSAHLVDNSPIVTQAIPYSRFWMEAIFGHSFFKYENPLQVYAQGAIGQNFKAEPRADKPRVLLGADINYEAFGAGKVSPHFSFDLRLTGVENQKAHYSFFLGISKAKRPNQTHHPMKIGLIYLTGSDHRNQFVQRKSERLFFAFQTEL